MARISEQIIDEIVADGWKSNPFEKLLPMLKEQREESLPLALMVIDRVPDGGRSSEVLEVTVVLRRRGEPE
jgi:hypothetical protein